MLPATRPCGYYLTVSPQKIPNRIRILLSQTRGQQRALCLLDQRGNRHGI